MRGGPGVFSGLDTIGTVEARVESQEPGAPGWLRKRRALLVVVLVALSLRLVVAAFCYPDITKPRLDHWPFGYETGRIARSLTLGQGFANPLYHRTGATAWMTPAYPLLLAGIFRAFGIYTTASALAILGLQGLFSALTCIPIFLLARRWFGERTALGSAWVWALFPYSVYLSSDFVWENCLSALLLTILIWLGLQLAERRSAWEWAGYGLLWGLGAMVNPAVLTVMPLVAGWALWRMRRAGHSWRAPVAALLAAFLLAIAPWEARNFLTFHQWVPFRDNFWLEMHVDNNGNQVLRWVDSDHPSNSRKELNEFGRMGETAYMALKRQQALQFIEGHPWEFAWLTARRILYTWTGYWDFRPAYLAEEPFSSWNILLATPLTLLMIFGLWFARRRRLEGAALIAPILAVYPAVYYVTHPDVRYRLLIDPEIAMLAVFAVVTLRELANARATPKQPAVQQVKEPAWAEIPAETAEP